MAEIPSAMANQTVNDKTINDANGNPHTARPNGRMLLLGICPKNEGLTECARFLNAESHVITRSGLVISRHVPRGCKKLLSHWLTQS